MTKHRQPLSPTPNVIRARRNFLDGTENAVKARTKAQLWRQIRSLLLLLECNNGEVRCRVVEAAASPFTATLLEILASAAARKPSTQTRKLLLLGAA